MTMKYLTWIWLMSSCHVTCWEKGSPQCARSLVSAPRQNWISWYDGRLHLLPPTHPIPASYVELKLWIDIRYYSAFTTFSISLHDEFSVRLYWPKEKNVSQPVESKNILSCFWKGYLFDHGNPWILLCLWGRSIWTILPWKNKFCSLWRGNFWTPCYCYIDAKFLQLQTPDTGKRFQSNV